MLLGESESVLEESARVSLDAIFVRCLTLVSIGPAGPNQLGVTNLASILIYFFRGVTPLLEIFIYHYWTSSSPDVEGIRGQINNQLSGQNWGVGIGMREEKDREGMD